MSGYLETFVKECMKAFVSRVNSSAIAFVDLPENVRLSHFRGGSKRVQEGVSKAKDTGDMAPLHDLARRLASVSAQPFEVVWEAFTETHANPNGNTLKELANKVGVDDLWAKMRSRVPVGHGDLRTFLDSFIAVRNECAHSGRPSSPPTQSDVMSYADSLTAIAVGFVDLLEEQLVAILT